MKTQKLITILLIALLFLSSGCRSRETVDPEAASETEICTTAQSSKTERENPSLPVTDSTLGEAPAVMTPSMEKLLRTSILPVGSTMYIWGGGWNEEDTGSGIESVTIGLSPAWAEFSSRQTVEYDYTATRYQIHDGLDCSGYMGWLVYNTFHTENGGAGYVEKAYTMAETFASYGWGDYLAAGTAVDDWKTGDICSMQGHVWMCLGSCQDGSVLLVHSSPPGVRLCGTSLADGSDSQAVRLAEEYMSACYPGWYERYPECAVSHSYLEVSSRMRWNSATLPDAQIYQNMSAEETAAFLFP